MLYIFCHIFLLWTRVAKIGSQQIICYFLEFQKYFKCPDEKHTRNLSFGVNITKGYCSLYFQCLTDAHLQTHRFWCHFPASVFALFSKGTDGGISSNKKSLIKLSDVTLVIIDYIRLQGQELTRFGFSLIVTSV